MGATKASSDNFSEIAVSSDYLFGHRIVIQWERKGLPLIIYYTVVIYSCYTVGATKASTDNLLHSCNLQLLHSGSDKGFLCSKIAASCFL